MDSRVFLALSLCLLSFFPDLAHSSAHRWFGDKNTEGSVIRLKSDVYASPLDPSRVTQISWRPRAFLYKGFLTHEECDHLVQLAKDKLEKSMVADNESGKSVESEVRTSSGMFLNKAQDEVVAGIEAKIAAWTFLPPENGEAMQILHYEHGQKYEPHFDYFHDKDTQLKEDNWSDCAKNGYAENGEAMQILHYEHGQKYEPHFDYFHDKANQELGGHRVATVLMYLSDVNKGGETIFPDSEGKDTQLKEDNWSDCAKNGYAVKPHKGDALLFFSLHLDATTDPLSLHGSCPVIEGEKWSATKWIHVRSFERMVKHANGNCVDENENCAQWAAAGECKKNPIYMVGSDDGPGACRKSCKVCS